MKYLKYFLSTITLVLAIYNCFQGSYHSTFFFIGFSLFIVLGDMLIPEDLSEKKYSLTFILNWPIYINFFLLLIFILMVVFSISNNPSTTFAYLMNEYIGVDLISYKKSLNLIDSIFLIFFTSLFIGIMGTVPGHEMIHRKKSKLDMFIGNWLMSLSWDCAFAVEHVYGHHKNIGLSSDPATAKRGESVYSFIIRAIINEHRDAWSIEVGRLERKRSPYLSLENRMIRGYLMSSFVTLLSFIVGGPSGMLVYLLCAFIAKSLLEVINYCEHYGLVRSPGNPVLPKHSWNSNKVLSSIYLYNVTRHSSHHEKANLKYWELHAYNSAPTLPYGYLTMLFLALLAPYYFHKIMSRKLIEWDNKFASTKERILSAKQNKSSGIRFLLDS